MTVYEHLDAKRRDIDEKVARNGLTAGLIVQKRSVLKALERLTIETGSREYVPPKVTPFPVEKLNEYGRFVRTR